MIVTYLRSSSYNNYDYCQMQYYMNYVLGLPRGSGKKADKGTIVHKVMECLSALKKEHQNLTDAGKPIGRVTIEDDALGEVSVDWSEWNSKRTLTNQETEKINKTRINKYNYKHQCKLPYDSIRMGESVVNPLIERSYEFYSKKSEHDWAPVDFKDCTNWTWMVPEYKNGLFDPRLRRIVATEPHFDQTFEEEWAKYDWEMPDGRQLSGNLSIKGTVDLITDLGDGVYEVIDWKGLPVETELPTPNGWTTMGEVKVGDTVFDKDGGQTKVIGKSQAKYKPCYIITFDDTNYVICDDEHLWYLDDGKTVSVTELEVGNKIEVTQPIVTKETELPIDPYLLGVWLGDGRNRSVEITSNDDAIFEEIKTRGYSLGKDTEKRSNLTTKTVLGVRKKFKELELLNNKHIPLIYLRASKEQRLDLLRGLMDTDGNVNRTRKQAVFTSCDKTLSDNVKELLLSLGQRVNQSHIKRKTNFSNNKIVEIYPLHFRPVGINPFLLKRKAEQIDPKWGPGRSNKRRIQKIELLGAEYKTQCIMVDSPTNTYLCTKNMIPTHNTGQRLDWATGEPKGFKKLCVDPQLRMYYLALQTMFSEAKQVIVSILFVRDGGGYSMCFDRSDIPHIKQAIRKRFDEIAKDKHPYMCDPGQKTFKCNKICDYYKMAAPDDSKNMCTFINNQIELYGIEEVTKQHICDGHSVDYYHSPGS